MKNFEVGKTYQMLWVGDADARTNCTVLKRTAKFVTFAVEGFGTKRVGVTRSTYEGDEMARPLGRYSMAPCVRATREVA